MADAQIAVRRDGSTSASAARQISSIGQNAVAVKWSAPPSGKSAAMARPPTTAGAPRLSAVRRASGESKWPASVATAATVRKTPATGLANTLASERTAAASRDRRAHAQAPTASAIPSVNGIRPITTLLMIPPRNSQAASAPTAGVGARRRASTAKRPTAATPATTPTSRVPASAASGG
jgi:hypothetical protein